MSAALVVLTSTAAAVFAFSAPALAAPVCTESRAVRGLWVPSTSSGNLDCVMGRGANSQAVAQLQATINECYLEPRREPLLGVDGDFGGRTETALKRVQGWIGTDRDGVYGKNTRNRMKFIDTEAFPLRCHPY
jgi:peptidoglycan hydrolase-like protein with peptidoglycan-binding domain